MKQLLKFYNKIQSEGAANKEMALNYKRQADSLDKILVNKLGVYADSKRKFKITWKDVQSNLGDRDVAIEFIEYPTIADDTVKYAALVLRKGWENPKFVPLFRKDQIDEIIKHGPNKIYSNGIVGKDIKKMV